MLLASWKFQIVINTRAFLVEGLYLSYQNERKLLGISLLS